MQGLVVAAALLVLPAPQSPGLYGAVFEVPAVTSVEIEGRRFGAQADAAGPIGGGAGYTRGLARGDFEARTLDELLAALQEATAGQVDTWLIPTCDHAEGYVVVKAEYDQRVSDFFDENLK